MQRHNRQGLLRRVVEHALEEALALACSIEEFSAGGRRAGAPRSGSCCAKCAWPSSSATSSSSSTSPTTWTWIRTSTASPCCSGDLQAAKKETLEALAASDIVVTSFYHVEEVRGRLASLGKPIVGISLEPEMGTIIRIAKIPKESTVGLVTTSEDFRAIIREILAEPGSALRPHPGNHLARPTRR